MIAIRVCPICKKVFEGRVGVPKVYCDECTMLEDFAASDEAREQSSWFLRILRILRILMIQKKKIQECMRQSKRNYSTL